MLFLRIDFLFPGAWARCLRYLSIFVMHVESLDKGNLGANPRKIGCDYGSRDVRSLLVAGRLSKFRF